MTKYEPTTQEIQQSYKTNTLLARAIHGHLTHCSYSKFDAHRWALKLIAANPQNGREVAICLANFDWMDEGAATAYRTSPRYRRQHDAVAQAYGSWKQNLERVAA